MDYYSAAVTRGRPWTATGDFTSLDTSDAIHADPGANLAVVVQRVDVEVYTSAPQLVTLTDGTDATVKFNGNDVGSHTLDFGPYGKRYTDSEEVKFTTLSAGVGFSWMARGYIEGAHSTPTAQAYP